MAESLMEYGVLGIVVAGISWYVIRITNFLQRDLKHQLEENDKRIEAITIGLINAIRDARLDIKYLKGFVTALKKEREREQK